MMSKISQIVLPFWVLARKYTDKKVENLERPACEMVVDNGVLTVTVHDPQPADASITNGTLILTF